jgi:hypothetical protein
MTVLIAMRGPWLNASRPGGTCLLVLLRSIAEQMSSNDEKTSTHQAIREE